MKSGQPDIVVILCTTCRVSDFISLTVARINAAKPKAKTYSLSDSMGLSLEVTPRGSKLWRFRYQLAGKRNRMSFGAYPSVTLKDARLKRDEARALLAKSIDPAIDKKNALIQQQGDHTFEAVAREWYEKQAKGWAPRHSNTVITRLESNVFPFVGSHPIAELNAQDMLAVVRRMGKRGALEVARRTRGICSQIFRYAVIVGKADRDPAADIQGALPPNRKTKHHASITDPTQVGELMRAIGAFSGTFSVQCALRFAPLVFVRPGELRHAEWTEIKLDTAEWRIPAEKMKMHSMHIVPLSYQALEILEKVKELTGNGRLRIGLKRAWRQQELLIMNNTALNSSIVATAGAFPEKVLSVKIEAALKIASCAYKVPIAIPAMTFIACVESSIGMTRGLQVKNDWTVYPNLFLSLKKRSYFTSNSSL